MLRCARNDVDMTSRSRGIAPEVCIFVCPPSNQRGRTEDRGCTLHPRSRVQFAHKNAHARKQVQRKHSGLPSAMVLRLISCSPRWTALLPPSSGEAWLPADLTPAVLPYYGAHISGSCRPLGLLANDLPAQPADAILAPLSHRLCDAVPCRASGGRGRA